MITEGEATAILGAARANVGPDASDAKLLVEFARLLTAGGLDAARQEEKAKLLARVAEIEAQES